jgi:hypothetical protein
MIPISETAVMKAVAICLKPYLKPEEAMIYCNLGRTQLTKKCVEYGIKKNKNGYLKKDDLDMILSGAATKLSKKVAEIKV